MFLKSCSSKLFKSPDFWWPILLVLLIVAGTYLRFYHADSKQFWGDEIHSYEASNTFDSFSSFYSFWRHDSRSIGVMDPPLFYIVNYFNASSSSAFFSHLRLRIPGIIFGILCIPLTFFLIRRFIKDQHIAILTSAFVAFSAYAIQYSQEYRPYSLLMLASLLFFYTFLLLWEKFSWKNWLYFLLASTFLIYTHVFGLFLLVVAYCFYAVRLICQKEMTPWNKVAILASLPLTLIVIYSPILLWLAEFSNLAKNGPTEGDKQLYKNTGPILPLLYKSFSTWRFGNLADYPETLYSFYTLTFLGFIAGCLLNLKRHMVLAGLIACYIAFTIGIYHFCSFPFDARRSIGILPVFLYFWVLGCLSPYIIVSRFKKEGKAKLIALPITIALFLGYAYVNFTSWTEYDANGWKNETGQADWNGIAKYVADNADTNNDVLIIDDGLWAGLHYRYYREINGVKIPTVQAKSIEQLNSIRKNKNIWTLYVCNRTKPVVANLLQQNTDTKWIPFFGSALAYLPKAPDSPETQTFAISQQKAGDFVCADSTGKPYDGTIEISDNKTKSSFNSSPQSPPTVSLKEGVYKTTPLNTPTTLTLFKRINDGEWNSPLEFSALKYQDPNLLGMDFPLVNGSVSTSLMYNSTLIYNCAIEQTGDYQLTLRVRNDIPGPVKIRVFAGGKECEPILFDKINNKFEERSTVIPLNSTLSMITLYCTSFSRNKDIVGPYQNTVTTFDMEAWKLTKQ